jgi:hypothetical protein
VGVLTSWEPGYQSVQRFVERSVSAQWSLLVDPLIRQLTEYCDLIDRMTRSQ